MWKAVMTLIALILVLIVVRPPESVPVSRPIPMDTDLKNPARYEHIGRQRFYTGELKRHIYEAPF